MDSNFIYYFLMGAAGAASGEFFKLYDHKSTLAAPKYAKLLKSPLFYFSVFGMLAASGFVCWAINSSAGTATAIQLLISGVGARSVTRGTISAGVRERGVTLGDDDEDALTLKDLFN